MLWILPRLQIYIPCEYGHPPERHNNRTEIRIISKTKLYTGSLTKGHRQIHDANQWLLCLEARALCLPLCQCALPASNERDIITVYLKKQASKSIKRHSVLIQITFFFLFTYPADESDMKICKIIFYQQPLFNYLNVLTVFLFLLLFARRLHNGLCLH